MNVYFIATTSLKSISFIIDHLLFWDAFFYINSDKLFLNSLLGHTSDR